METKQKFIVLMIIMQLSIFGANINIGIENNYCSGDIWINPGDNSMKSDTITFSTAFSLNIMWFIYPFETTSMHSAACLFKTNSFKRIFYKYDSSITKKIIYPEYRNNSLMSMGNPDTIWNQALQIPDSSLSLDTIRKNPDTNISYMGKWCFHNDGPDLELGCYSFALYDNYNAIIYAICFDNRKIKLQIEEFKKEIKATFPKGHPCAVVEPGDTNNYWIDSVRIRWAADSMGNGIFKEEPVSTFNFNAVKKGSVSNDIIAKAMKGGIEFILPSQKVAPGSLQITNLKGTCIYRWQKPGQRIIWNTQAVAAGVYFANVMYADQQQESVRFIVKK